MHAHIVFAVQAEEVQIRLDEAEELILPAAHEEADVVRMLGIQCWLGLIGYRVNYQLGFVDKGTELEAAIDIKEADVGGRDIGVAEGGVVKVVRREELGKHRQHKQHDDHQRAGDGGFAAAESLPDQLRVGVARLFRLVLGEQVSFVDFLRARHAVPNCS